ncbi:MAG: ferritin-like domain-containing protein [Thermoleophilia bacterium]|nr:ferritin-like domain-containing protein [Thermoleophilia bacterium]
MSERLEPVLPDAGMTIEELDRDGAILEAVDRVHGSSRAEFIRSALLGSGALLAAFSAPPAADAKTNDVGILNFDLTFEHLQATFYTETERVGTIAKMAKRRAFWAQTLGAHERAHVKILQSVLGAKANPKPSFNFRGATESEESFVRTAVAMEDLTVTLLAGQVPRLANQELVAAVFTLLTVEARHAAWARNIVGAVPVAQPVDDARSLDAVAAVVRRTRFVTSRPETVSSQPPKFTG